MNKPIIKAIIFDLGGVIAHGGYLPFIKEYCAKCLTSEGKQKIADLEQAVNLGTITEEEFYARIKEVFDVQLSPQQMHDMIVERMKVDTDLVNIIDTIEKTKIVLFSNSIGHMAAQLIRKEGLDKTTFDQTFFSNEIHLAKPDTQAYQHVVQNLKVKPEETLMIDDREENIASAKKAGLHGIVYKNAQQFQQELGQYELV